MKTRVLFAVCIAGAMLTSLSSCQKAAVSGSTAKTVFFMNITGDGSDDLQRLDMAMKLAGFALDEKRDVFIFFNVKGVHVPTKKFSADVKFKDDKPIKEQLAGLIERGAVVHVCPICMKALGVDKDDIIEGASVTTRPKLFAEIGANTAVFTY